MSAFFFYQAAWYFKRHDINHRPTSGFTVLFDKKNVRSKPFAKYKEVVLMAVRKIIEIDEEKCNGCGLCVPSCAEGAIQIIDGKARLVKDSYCDGLGACLGHCPQGALRIIEREAEDFNEEEARKFAESVRAARQRQAFFHHHRGGGGCPGSRMRVIKERKTAGEETAVENSDISVSIRSQLRQWPVQLDLVPVKAPWFENADLLVCADCVPFACANFHLRLLKGKTLVIGCPKLDDVGGYVDKLAEILMNNNIRSITVAHMEVPCCSGIVRAVETALAIAGSDVPVHNVTISIDGEIM